MTPPPSTPAPVSFQITAAMVARFAQLSGDHSSLHMDAAFARRSLFRGNVAHGFLPLLFLSVLRFTPPPGTRYRFQRLAASFLQPIYPGDHLILAVTDFSPSEDARRLEIEFSLTQEPSRTLVTTGSAILEATALDEPKQTRSGACEGTADFSLLPTPLTEQTHTLDEINKGDTTNFAFTVTPAALQSVHEILALGLPSAAPDQSSSSPACDPANLLPASLLSTLVGMCQPGRTATFLNFDITFARPFEFDHPCRLHSTVAFKSPTTLTLSQTVRLTGAADDTTLAEGKVHVRVNPPPTAMATMQELSETALDLGLRGKVVLITGGSRGIGETTAKLFALHGARIALNYFNGEDEARRTTEEIRSHGASAICLRADVTDRAQVAAMVAEICREFGTVDILVNNAVRDFQPIPFQELTWDRLQQDLDVILKGAFNCCQEVLPHMVRQRSGKIISLSTIFAENPPLQQAKYVIAKNALIGLSRTLAVEFAPHNIQVNLVTPSMVETDLTRRLSRIFVDRVINETPMRRLATPVEVAKAIIFLASSLSSFTTGQKVMVTGGSPPLF